MLFYHSTWLIRYVDLFFSGSIVVNPNPNPTQEDTNTDAISSDGINAFERIPAPKGFQYSG